jgi:hypothetical protein
VRKEVKQIQKESKTWEDTNEERKKMGRTLKNNRDNRGSERDGANGREGERESTGKGDKGDKEDVEEGRGGTLFTFAEVPLPF